MTPGNEFSYESDAVPPGAIFVAMGECALIFPSAAAGQKLLKASDVEDGLCRCAFGPNGEPYRIVCEGNRVLISRTGESSQPDDLRALLLQHLEACEDPADATQPLDEIVAIAWSIERNFCLRNDPYGDRSQPHVLMLGGIVFLLGLGALWYFGLR